MDTVILSVADVSDEDTEEEQEVVVVAATKEKLVECRGHIAAIQSEINQVLQQQEAMATATHNQTKERLRVCREASARIRQAWDEDKQKHTEQVDNDARARQALVAQVSQLESDLRQTETTNASLREALQAEQEAVARWRVDLTNKEREWADAQQQTQAANASLRADLLRTQTANSALQDAVAACRTELTKREEHWAEVQRQLDTGQQADAQWILYKADLATARDDVKRAEDRIAALEAQVRALEDVGRTQTDALRKADDDLREAHRRHGICSAERDGVRRELLISEDKRRVEERWRAAMLDDGVVDDAFQSALQRTETWLSAVNGAWRARVVELEAEVEQHRQRPQRVIIQATTVRRSRSPSPLSRIVRAKRPYDQTPGLFVEARPFLNTIQ